MKPTLAALLWTLGLVPGALPAQAKSAPSSVLPGPVVELDGPAQERAAIRLQRNPEGSVDVVTWGEIRIPLAEAAKDCAVALAPGGRELLLLVGGVRDSLDLYLVRGDGEFERYQTLGGRRLARTFNQGAGSWPVVEGRHLLLFAYQKGGGIEFRAMDFRGRVFLARTLPGRVEGWRAESDPETGEVRVTFGGDAAAVSFRHPLAPRLELQSGELRFGEVEVGKRSRRMLELTNRGQRPLRLRVEPPVAGFEVMTEAPAGIAAGASVRLRVDFAPARAGEFAVPLRIFATGVVPEHIVRLRGLAKAPAAAGALTEATTPAERSAPPPVGEAPLAASDDVLVAPRVAEVRFFPRGDGEVLVCGRLQDVPAGGRPVLLGAGAVEAEVDADETGFFAGCIAAAGQPVRLVVAVAAGKVADSGTGTGASAGGRSAADAGTAAAAEKAARKTPGAGERRSSAVVLGAAPRMLTVAGESAEVRGLPGEPFLLTARYDGTVLRRWQGRTDGRGRRRIPLSILDPEAAGSAALTLEVTIVADGQARTSSRVALPRR